MAEYHVGCGLAGIYAGTLKKNKQEWMNKSDVTDEAIDAVRDYFFGKMEYAEKTSYGYSWKLKDGRLLKLFVTISEEDNEENE